MTFHSGLFRVLRPALAAATAGGSVLLVSHPHAEPNMKQDILKQSPSQRKGMKLVCMYHWSVTHIHSLWYCIMGVRIRRLQMENRLCANGWRWQS